MESEAPPVKEEEVEEAPLWSCINFAHPLELLAWIDPAIQSGELKLYPWQIKASKLIGTPGIFEKKAPLDFLMRCSNGSGKDAYIIAPTAIWFCLSKIRSRCVVTSSSHVQMERQTASYIKNRARTVNLIARKQGIYNGDLFEIKKDHIYCPMTGSEIHMFVTDDPGRAEGYHPWPDWPNTELMIIANEAKTIPDEIFEALSRCTFTHWLEVSTPGHTSGHFFNHVKRSVHYPAPYVRGERYSIRVTSFDCPHVSKKKIEDDKEDFGEDSAIFRSKHLALFTSLDEATVISVEVVNKLHQDTKYGKEKFEEKVYRDVGSPRRGGLDLAAGGDENTLYIFKNNRCIGREIFTCSNTNTTVELIPRLLDKWMLLPENVFADDGGVGKSMLDNLVENQGVVVNRVRNQSRASNHKLYANRGAELWFNFKRFVEQQLVLLPVDDEKLWEQLGNRHYKQQTTTGRICLEAKSDAKAHGRPSPDRADAVVLAFSGVFPRHFLGIDEQPSEKRESVSYSPELHAKRQLTTRSPLQGLFAEQRKSSKKKRFMSSNNIVRTLHRGKSTRI